MASTTRSYDRVRKHREAMKRAGMRPVQLWVPDTRRPDFTREASRQARLIRACDAKQGDELAFSELAAAQIEGWE